MVYTGKSSYKWMIWGYPHFRNPPYNIDPNVHQLGDAVRSSEVRLFDLNSVVSDPRENAPFLQRLCRQIVLFKAFLSLVSRFLFEIRMAGARRHTLFLF